MKKVIVAVVSIMFVLGGIAVSYIYMSKNQASPVVTKILPEPTVVVTRTQNGYEPKEITIKKGEVVLWKNESKDYHWPASDLHPTHAIYSEFDPLKPVGPGQDWAFQFNQAGTWKYHDHIRANKVGTITVID
jgi:plastocyanin